MEKLSKENSKKKALEQFKKKVTDENSLSDFDKGFNDYLKYIQLNEWYSPAELFRWIRDERYKDEYDLTPKKSNGKRFEKVPAHIKEPPKGRKTDSDVLLEADKIIEERRKHGRL